MIKNFIHKPLSTYGLSIEIFSLLLIIISCFLIFYKTKEIYELSNHKGLNYFRKGFLFFGIAHLVNLLTFIIQPFIEFRLFRGLFPLFSLIALLFLLASLFSKKIKNEYLIYLITIIILGLTFLFKARFFVLLYGFILIFTLGIISYLRYRKSKKKLLSQIYIIYMLLFLFWVINMIGMTITHILDIGRFYITLISAIFFLYILYRVLKRLRID